MNRALLEELALTVTMAEAAYLWMQAGNRNQELADHGLERKGIGGDHTERASSCGIAGGLLGVPGDCQSRRFGAGRTHKASSAESILRHVLRQRGWSAAWRRGELSGKRQLDLLADIREYGRAWLHHEAESFIRHYGRPIDAPSQFSGENQPSLGASPGRNRTLATGAFSGDSGPVTGHSSMVSGASIEHYRDDLFRHGFGGFPDKELTDVRRNSVSLGPGDGDRADGVGDNPVEQAEFALGTAIADRDTKRMDDRGICQGESLVRTVDGVERALGAAIASHLRRWFGRVRSFVRESIVAGALALTGPRPLSADDLAEIDSHVAVQEQYLERFRLDVESRPPAELAEPSPFTVQEGMTAAQFAARAEMYGDAAWGAAQQVERLKFIKGRAYVSERRVHGILVDDMCSTCREAVAAGWVPIGTLPAIGDSECVGNCHCYFQYMDAEGRVAKQVRPFRGRKPRLTRKPVIEPIAKPEPESESPKVESKQEPPKSEPKPARPKPTKKPVKVQPIEPTAEPPEIVIGPWVDANGNAITYHYEEAP